MENRVICRAEQQSDFRDIANIHIKNFGHDLEAMLIDNLRKEGGYMPYFSQVLTLNNVVIGHAMLTPVKIQNCDYSLDALILGPVGIAKEFQSKGYGEILIRNVLKIAKENGHKIILVYGGNYYVKFGFKKADYVYRPNPVLGHGILMNILEPQKEIIKGVIHYPHSFDPLINEWKNI